MGLQEKRAIAQLRDETLPKYQGELRQITASEVSYVVDWDTFTNDLTAIGNLESKCLKVVSEVFRNVTRDAIGKEAVAQSIKQIHLSHGKTANIGEFTLADGVLSMPWDWSGWPGSFYPDSVQEKIESML